MKYWGTDFVSLTKELEQKAFRSYKYYGSCIKWHTSAPYMQDNLCQHAT